MKTLLLFLASSLLVSGCVLLGTPVCGRDKNTNNCRTFRNPCDFLPFSYGDYEAVDMKHCRNEIGTESACFNPMTTKSPTWTCPTNCTPRRTSKVCTYKLHAHTEKCRLFRNKCQFKNFNCDYVEPLYAVAHKSRCANLTVYNIDGDCI